jgi:hypothetical protein
MKLSFEPIQEHTKLFEEDEARSLSFPALGEQPSNILVCEDRKVLKGGMSFCAAIVFETSC